MTSLLRAILFTFTVRRKVAMADESRVGPLWSKLVALVSVVLWSGVRGRGTMDRVFLNQSAKTSATEIFALYSGSSNAGTSCSPLPS